MVQQKFAIAVAVSGVQLVLLLLSNVFYFFVVVAFGYDVSDDLGLLFALFFVLLKCCYCNSFCACDSYKQQQPLTENAVKYAK